MTATTETELDWEPEADDPDDSLRYEAFVVTNSDGLYWSGSDWVPSVDQAQRHCSSQSVSLETETIIARAQYLASKAPRWSSFGQSLVEQWSTFRVIKLR